MYIAVCNKLFPSRVQSAKCTFTVVELGQVLLQFIDYTGQPFAGKPLRSIVIDNTSNSFVWLSAIVRIIRNYVQFGDGFPLLFNLLPRRVYIILNLTLSQHWGVPQRRARIFLVADFGGLTAPKILFKPESLPGYTAPVEGSWKTAAEKIGSCFAGAGGLE